MPDAEAVYQQYRDRVYGYLFRMCRNYDLAEELTQETFYQAMKQWNRFEGRSDIGTWLCAIARRQYYMILRKPAPEPVADLPESASPDFAESVANRSIALNAYKALHCLQEPYREVFTLRLFSELSFKEIAEVFGKTENWARVTSYRAKQMLADTLKGDIQNE